MNDFFEKVISAYTSQDVEVLKVAPASGGCINNAAHLCTTGGDFFLKWNKDMPADMFEAEKKGLDILREAAEIKVPEAFHYGNVEGKGFLLLEFLPSGAPSKKFWENFGHSLAALHKHNSPCFGLDHNNYIGRLPQKNNFEADWSSFFMNRRIIPQLNMAQDKDLVNTALVSKFDNLFKALEHIFPEERPALLHGDLWSGNFLCGKDGEACIIDPAVYYGSREMEIAYTYLFGGFDDEFYKAYNEAFPLQQGFDTRIEIYNLYPLLVHVNLFGTSYLPAVKNIMDKF